MTQTKSKRAAFTRTAAAGLTLTFGLASAVLMAPPASAAQQTLSVDCSTASTSAVTLNVGDTLLISTASCTSLVAGGPGGTWSYGPTTGAETPDGPGARPAFAVNNKVLFTAVQPSFAPTGAQFNSGTVSVNITVLAVSESSSGPGPEIQQFGKPASGTCDAAAPSTLNWSGVPSGGWSESWSRWINNGNGGAVCTRTLMYSISQAKWIVG